MKRPKWIDPRVPLLLQGETLAEHGGLAGLRDEAGLEAALARPRHVHNYEPASDLARLAAAYGFVKQCGALQRGLACPDDGNVSAGIARHVPKR